jgi:hypothetical protein
MEGQDVDDDRPQNQKPEVPGLGNGDQHATEDFQNLDEGEITRGSQGGHKQLMRRVGRRRVVGHRDEIQEEVQSENEEQQAKQASGDVGCDFHDGGFQLDVGVDVFQARSKRMASVFSVAAMRKVPAVSVLIASPF